MSTPATGINAHLCKVLNERQDKHRYECRDKWIMRYAPFACTIGLFTDSLDSCLLVRAALTDTELCDAWEYLSDRDLSSDITVPDFCGPEQLARAMAVATGWVEENNGD